MNVPRQNAAAIQQYTAGEEVAPQAVALPADDDRASLRLDDLRPQPRLVPPEPVATPRKFRSRTFVVGAFTVTVAGEDDAYENEFWPKQEGDELLLLFHDAAIEARLARQGGGLQPARETVQTSAPRAIPAPREEDASSFDPRTRYSEDRLARSAADVRRFPDPQDEALREVGMDMESLVGNFNPALAAPV